MYTVFAAYLHNKISRTKGSFVPNLFPHLSRRKKEASLECQCHSPPPQPSFCSPKIQVSKLSLKGAASSCTRKPLRHVPYKLEPDHWGGRTLDFVFRFIQLWLHSEYLVGLFCKLQILRLKHGKMPRRENRSLENASEVRVELSRYVAVSEHHAFKYDSGLTLEGWARSFQGRPG